MGVCILECPVLLSFSFSYFLDPNIELMILFIKAFCMNTGKSFLWLRLSSFLKKFNFSLLLFLICVCESMFTRVWYVCIHELWGVPRSMSVSFPITHLLIYGGRWGTRASGSASLASARFLWGICLCLLTVDDRQEAMTTQLSLDFWGSQLQSSSLLSKCH